MSSIQERIETVTKALEELSNLNQTEEILNATNRLKLVLNQLEKQIATKASAWDKVLIARKLERPRAEYYIQQMVDGFIELHGDRTFADDPAIIGGIGKIEGHVVTIIAQNKGNSAKENIRKNFGMPHPEGYRKALRLMKQAEHFNRPIICLIDTPGAYCGIGAEERGQGEAIAHNLIEMSRLKVPIIAGVIGEGGSGGALALGVADRVFMQEYAIYSILSPEGFASILWKDSHRAKEAAEKMKITAENLLELGIIDEILEEPVGGAHNDPKLAADILKSYVVRQLSELKKVPKEELVEKRYARFRSYGEFLE